MKQENFVKNIILIINIIKNKKIKTKGLNYD